MRLLCRRSTRVALLTKRHRQLCLQWAREHRDWTMDEWKRVAWSDESRFLIHHVACGIYAQASCSCFEGQKRRNALLNFIQEAVDKLTPGQKSIDRYDISARVFGLIFRN
ncbi:hypothetical protein AVEN_20079-1 [Araneus ventricosus]|uniref:Transposase Tc1-like domain-containing protein n=1 Tax=Araneus ventricosus TaxID=182803 RepID=A0A4Y2CZT1_ARAVE|nr:hypothetical protein AVEN_20079-1 [Araneus ventricosus]